MRRKATLTLIFCLLFGVWIIVAPFLATHLIVEKPLEHADAIMVLSGSAVYKERTKKAAELYKQGIAPIVIVTDDGERARWFDSDKTNPTIVELEQRELIANGVIPEAIRVLPGKVAGTDDEAKALRDEIAARPLGSVLIVTSAYHTRRALATFEKILAGKNVTLGIASPPPGDYTPTPNYWWLKLRGWQTVAGEYVKSAVYWAYY
ncbi:MAG: YdcF family protein [Chloracidobacterium sp.]|nr:YdcF family protein [Chloracidobacterium sp.]